MLAHLLKYDTTQGNYANSHTVTYKDAVLAEDGKTVVTPGSITVDGTEITIYACAKAQDLPWKKLKVDVVLECTGFYTSKAKSSGSYRRRREERCYLRSRGQRPPDNRLQRKPQDAYERRSYHFRSFLHHQLPRSYG